VILANKLRPADAAGRAGAQVDGWSAGLANYTPEQVEKATGVAAKRIDRLAREFAERRPAVAVIGGAPLAHTNGLFHALAVNALNALVGSVGVEGGILFMPQGGSPPSAVSSQQALSPQPSVLRSQSSTLDSAKALLIDDVNPVFGTPKAWGMRQKLEKIPFIASFGSFIDETSILADLILPDHSFLESWTDSLPESGASAGVANAAGPAMRPLHQTRATPDVLLDVAGKLKKPVQLPWKTFDEMLKASFDTVSAEAWATVQKQGWVSIPDSAHDGLKTVPYTRGTVGDALQGVPAKWTEPQFDGEAGAYPFHFMPYASQALFDGSIAHLPWLQELPDPLTSAMWSSWVEINPATAQKLNIAQGDLVDVTSTQGTLRAPAMMSPGIAPDAIAMPVGQGHDTFTRYASKRGVNPISILAPVAEPETGALAWSATRVKIARAADPDGSLIMFAGEMREHPHEHEVR
jgi:anaerobic selenocysteine-containing dehydrogenase